MWVCHIFMCILSCCFISLIFCSCFVIFTHFLVSSCFVAGYGNIAPRTTLGRIVTLGYAVLGIPLTLVYLSSTGGVLARVARGVFSRYVMLIFGHIYSFFFVL